MRLKRMVDKFTEPEKLKKWKRILETSIDYYSKDRAKMDLYDKYYDGDRSVQANPNSGKTPTKQATNVRNIVYELIESQVDSAIPAPKIRAIHERDTELAKKLEHLLENKIKTCGLTKLNDSMERNVKIIGGDFFHVQWDSTKGLHSEIGDLRITEVYPKKLIPQVGVTELEDMDYFFVQELMTKKNVKRMYKVDVSDAVNDYYSNNEDVVTVNTVYYRNDKSGVGIYVWCDVYELLDMEDYEARNLVRCKKCHTVMVNGVCPECGSKKGERSPEEYEELVDAIEVKTDFGGIQSVNPMVEEEVPVLDENGQPLMNGDTPVMEIKKSKKKIPYYKPNVFPIVLWKNITEYERFLGGSDVKVILDQQDTVKKMGTKINEKLLKGGSFVTLPRNKKVETTDEELKIVRVDDEAEARLISVINVQPNTQMDASYLETNYQWAKSSLGITDSYQGKYDASATSGTAKQYAINQAAGRLESKRTLKNEAYAKLYEIMFKFWLAYSDQTAEINYEDSDGQDTYDSIDRKEFLRIDKAGEFYWNDEFIFETDPTSTLMTNREALWSQADVALQAGAYGQLGDLNTARLYWKIQRTNGKPGAQMALRDIEERIAKQEEMQNAMSQMQNGNENPLQQISGAQGWQSGVQNGF